MKSKKSTLFYVSTPINSNWYTSDIIKHNTLMVLIDFSSQVLTFYLIVDIVHKIDRIYSE